MAWLEISLKATFKSFVFFALIALSTVVNAMEPIRDSSSLWDPKKEEVVRVNGARVILADYALIKRDFHQVANFSNAEIDEWLIRHTAFISKAQAGQSVVNDPISISGEERIAFRPQEYRRAHVFSVDTGGLIDAKGSGAIDPHGGDHDNGLASLGDMIREYAYEKLVHAIFKANNEFDTVGSYAVIDYGFSIVQRNKSRSRAGLILRQAHERYHADPVDRSEIGLAAMLPREQQVKIEKLLRRYGISSSILWGHKELVNLQGTTKGAVVDFGAFLTKAEFHREVYFFYDSTGHVTGSDLIMKPGESEFVEVDPKLHIPFDLWGYSVSGKENSKYDNPYIWSHELAESLAHGRAQRADAEQHIRNLFDRNDVQRALKTTGRAHVKSCEAAFEK